MLGACHAGAGVVAPVSAPADVLFTSDYERETYEPAAKRLGAPGYDVVWLDRRGPSYVFLAEGAAFVVDGDGAAFGGASFSSLRPLGFSIPTQSSIQADGQGLYWFAPGPALWKATLGSTPERLWAGQGDLNKVRQDRDAFYVEFLRCRACPADHLAEIWRFLKAGGPPALLLRTHPDELIADFRSDGTSLVVWTSAARGSGVQRIPLTGGPAFDGGTQYERRLLRVPPGGGPGTEIQVTRDHLTDDGQDFFFLEGSELTAGPMGGGALRLLADFSNASCHFCGHSRMDVCVSCGDAVYLVPKAPRAAARVLAGSIGRKFTVTDDAYFSDFFSRKRNLIEGQTCEPEPHFNGSPPTRPSCWTVVAHDEVRSALASGLVADSGYLYFLLGDGSVRRMRPELGAIETLVPAPPGRETPRSSPESSLRTLVVDASSVTWADSARGAVLRVPKTGGAPVVLRSGLTLPVLAQQGTSLAVVSAMSSADAYGHAAEWRAASLDGGYAEIGSVDLPAPESPEDVAMTNEAVYVVFSTGLARIPRKGGSSSFVLPTLQPAALAADERTLYFSGFERVMAIEEGAALPTVLASGLRGTPDTLLRYADALYFRTPMRHKWLKWAPLTAVPLGPVRR
jgi:hypothetical protein